MRLVITLSLCFLASSAVAENFDSSLTAYGGFRGGGSVDLADETASYDFGDDTSFGLIWNHRHDANTEWEVLLTRHNTEAELTNGTLADPIVDVEMTSLELGGTYLWEGEKVVPYLAATLGGTHIRTDSVGSDSETLVSGSIGLGLKILPQSRMGLRLEARAHGVLIRDNTRLFCQTGPAVNACAIEVQGELLTQIQAFAGFSFRF